MNTALISDEHVSILPPPEEIEYWRRTLPHLVAPDKIVATAALGTASPEWERLQAASYPDRVALGALATRQELLAAMVAAEIGAGMRVLDMGCGAGLLSRYLLEAGASAVIGLDSSPTMLEMARALPFPNEKQGTLIFVEADGVAPLPFPDGYFDVVWMGDFWLPQALPELRRVLRPGGRLVDKSTGTLPGLLYSWDDLLEARLQLALRQGTRKMQGSMFAGTGRTTLYGYMLAAGPWASLRIWTAVVSRCAPVPPIFEEWQRQNFALFAGGFIKDQVVATDWDILQSLWDPAAADYLFRRPDGYFVQTITMAVGILTG